MLACVMQATQVELGTMRLMLPCMDAPDCLAARRGVFDGAASVIEPSACGGSWPAEAVLELQAARLVLFGPAGGLLAGGAGAAFQQGGCIGPRHKLSPMRRLAAGLAARHDWPGYTAVSWCAE